MGLDESVHGEKAINL